MSTVVTHVRRRDLLERGQVERGQSRDRDVGSQGGLNLGQEVGHAVRRIGTLLQAHSLLDRVEVCDNGTSKGLAGGTGELLERRAINQRSSYAPRPGSPSSSRKRNQSRSPKLRLRWLKKNNSSSRKVCRGRSPAKGSVLLNTIVPRVDSGACSSRKPTTVQANKRTTSQSSGHESVRTRSSAAICL